MKKFFAGHGNRIPITITITEKKMPLLIDDMYEIACKYISPTDVDKILSDCVVVARSEADYYDARLML